jgi:activating signal cointegrator complex subunit 3
VQSIVYPVAYKSGNNMLVCAPTGAGKTECAMMTVLHCLEQHLHRGVLKSDEFKIVYVAPMKALASEVTDNMYTHTHTRTHTHTSRYFGYSRYSRYSSTYG